MTAGFLEQVACRPAADGPRPQQLGRDALHGPPVFLLRQEVLDSYQAERIPFARSLVRTTVLPSCGNLFSAMFKWLRIFMRETIAGWNRFNCAGTGTSCTRRPILRRRPGWHQGPCRRKALRESITVRRRSRGSPRPYLRPSPRHLSRRLGIGFPLAIDSHHDCRRYS